jgi:hypothetical protein
VEAEPQEVVTDPGVEGGAVEEAAPAAGERPGVDVLGDGHVGDDLGLLADDADAVAARVGGGVQVEGPIVEEDTAEVGPVVPVQDLDEGGFSGAVLAHERGHPT